MAFAENMLGGLNAAQRIAVTSTSQVVQVLAPPGSGKTKTLTARVAYLISHMGKDPSKIIVCTFTVKAAREMKDRLTCLLGKEVTAKLILGTFHSICLRLLTVHGRHVALNQKFGIADSSDSNSIIARIVKRLGLTIEPKTARNRISALKSQGRDVQAYAEERLHRVSRRTTAVSADEQQEFLRVFSAYEEHLRLSNLLDYDDLLLRCRELLDCHPACVSGIQALLIDEFQDTNFIQFELMKGFSSARGVVTTVGDPDQSIYGWRSADVTNLAKMREHFRDLHVVNLQENYRTSGAILLAAQELIEQDKSRPVKTLVPTHGVGLPPVLRILPDAGREASWIVSEIVRTRSLSAGVLDWNDYAILLRSAALSRLVETSLGKAGIPYRMVGGHRFFDRYEVKLVLDYLRVMDMTTNSDTVLRILNVPARQIGEVTLQNLVEESIRRQVTLWDLVHGIVKQTIRPKLEGKTTDMLSKQATKGLETFFDIIHRGRTKLHDNSTDSLTQFIEWLIKKIALKEHLKSKYGEEFDTRWANVAELINNAAEGFLQTAQEDNKWSGAESSYDPVEAVPFRSDILRSFLANVALSTEAQNVTDSTTQKFVTVSTIHAAKGLEWPIVFIPAVYVGSIPHSRSEDHDEELRLLYVAMTRAKVMLYLSQPKKDSRAGDTTLSTFLCSTTLKQHFVQAGATLQGRDISDMCRVLTRSCPTSKAIDEAQMNTSPKEDVKYLRKSCDGDDLEFTDDSDQDQSRRKRHREECDAVPSFRSVRTLVHNGQYAVRDTTLGHNQNASTNMNSMVTAQDTLKGTKQLSSVKKRCSQSSVAQYFRPTSLKSVPSSTSHSSQTRPLRTLSTVSLQSLGSAETVSLQATKQEDCSLQGARHTGDMSLRSINNIRPANILHQTTQARVSQPLKRLPSLGVRRSMNGWESRKHK